MSRSKATNEVPAFVKEGYKGPYNIGGDFTTSDIGVKFYVGHKPNEYGWYAYIDSELYGRSVTKSDTVSLDDMFDLLRQNAYETLIAYYKKKSERI